MDSSTKTLLEEVMEATNIIEPYTPTAPQMNSYTPIHQPVYTSVPQNTMHSGYDSYYTTPQVNYTPQFQPQPQQPQQQSQQQVHMAYLSKIGTAILEEIKTVNINLVKLNSNVKDSRRHRTECDVKFKTDQITVPILFTSATTTQQENNKDEEQKDEEPKDGSTRSNKRPSSDDKQVGSIGRGAYTKPTSFKKPKK
jgi:hypothetical protein